jgi:hypothetical protein
MGREARSTVVVLGGSSSICRWVERSGRAVVRAATIHDALRSVFPGAVRSLLVDVDSGDDPVEIIRLLRRDPFLRELSVVAFGSAARLDDARAAGADACLDVPVRSIDIVASLDRLDRLGRAKV